MKILGDLRLQPRLKPEVVDDLAVEVTLLIGQRQTARFCDQERRVCLATGTADCCV
jgi:hypothetical protein